MWMEEEEEGSVPGGGVKPVVQGSRSGGDQEGMKFTHGPPTHIASSLLASVLICRVRVSCGLVNVH